MLAHSGCEYESTAYIETMTDLTRARSLCTVHAELAEDPSEDLAEDVEEVSGDDDTAEDPAAPAAPAGSPVTPSLRKDDYAEEV